MKKIACTDDSDPSFQIQCRNVQERPPLESFNEVKSPFLPCVSSSTIENHDEFNQYNIDNPVKLAHALTNQYDLWKTRVSNKSLSKVQWAENEFQTENSKILIVDLGIFGAS